MARGSSDAKTAAGTGNEFARTYEGNAQSIFTPLSSTLQTEMAHPAGMSPADLAAENTSSQQSVGGSQSAAVGQGALAAARTRNAGAPDAAIEASSRHAGETLAKNALQTRLKNAAIKLQQ